MMNFLDMVSNIQGRGKMDMKYIGKLDKVLLVRVIIPPLDKYNCFQLANRHSIFSITPSQKCLVLKDAPKGRPRYFNGSDETPLPKIQANPSYTLTTFPAGANSNLAKFLFKPDTE
jgi:hypothetical protein